MKLTALKPRVGTICTTKVRTLTEVPGATPRIRGRAWMEARDRIALAQGYRCTDCGLLWRPHLDDVDHETPLEQGGSNDDANLRLRCWKCHQVKTAAEALGRATRRIGL